MFYILCVNNLDVSCCIPGKCAAVRKKGEMSQNRVYFGRQIKEQDKQRWYKNLQDRIKFAKHALLDAQSQFRKINRRRAPNCTKSTNKSLATAIDCSPCLLSGVGNVVWRRAPYARTSATKEKKERRRERKKEGKKEKGSSDVNSVIITDSLNPIMFNPYLESRMTACEHMQQLRRAPTRLESDGSLWFLDSSIGEES